MRDIKLLGFEFKNKPEGGYWIRVNGLWIAAVCYLLYLTYSSVIK